MIGTTAAHRSFERSCPSAKTLTGYSKALERWCVIQIRCKRWGCRHCGQRKVIHFAWRVLDAKPNRLVTLTVNNSRWDSPRAAYEGTKGDVTRFATKLRRRVEEFEYFRVLEVTKKGWPHYHLVVRSPYLYQPMLSELWDELTGAPIVDVRQIKKTRDVYYYVVKYLAKQKYVPWTNRRVSWTRRFFPENEWKAPTSLDLISKGWHDEHPSEVLRKHYHPFKIAPYSQDCWTVAPEDGEPLGRTKRFKHS